MGKNVTRKTAFGTQKRYVPSQKEVIDTMDRNMKPLGKQATLNRFIDNDDPLFKAKVGETVTNKGYTSVTDQANHIFAPDRVGRVEIRVPANAKVYVPKERSEGETIIHRDASFKVISRTPRDGKMDIVVEIVEN